MLLNQTVNKTVLSLTLVSKYAYFLKADDVAIWLWHSLLSGYNWRNHAFICKYIVFFPTHTWSAKIGFQSVEILGFFFYSSGWQQVSALDFVKRSLKHPVFTQLGVYCNWWSHCFFLLVKLFNTSVYKLAYPLRSSEWPYIFSSVVVCTVILSNTVSK